MWALVFEIWVWTENLTRISSSIWDSLFETKYWDVPLVMYVVVWNPGLGRKLKENIDFAYGVLIHNGGTGRNQ